jgi:hypothetical protein
MKNSLTIARNVILLCAMALLGMLAPRAWSEEVAPNVAANSDRPTTHTGNPSRAGLPSFMSDKLTTEGIERHLGEPGVVRLTWKTQSEENTFGFNVMRRTSQTGKPERINGKPILGAGNSSTENFYEYCDKTVKVGDTYYYSLQEINLSGQVSDFSPVIGRRVCYLNLEAKPKPGKDACRKDKPASRTKIARNDKSSTQTASR